MEYYRVHFGRTLYTETFDDYRDVENAMVFFQGRDIDFTVERSSDGNDWRPIARPALYRAPGREYTPTPGEYDCAECGLKGGH